jgi:hypothetical protein
LTDRVEHFVAPDDLDGAVDRQALETLRLLLGNRFWVLVTRSPLPLTAEVVAPPR